LSQVTSTLESSSHIHFIDQGISGRTSFIIGKVRSLLEISSTCLSAQSDKKVFENPCTVLLDFGSYNFGINHSIQTE